MLARFLEAARRRTVSVTPGDYSLPPDGTRAAYQIVSRTVDYPVTSDDDSVMVAAFNGVLDDGRSVTFPAATLPATAGTKYGVFYSLAAGGYILAADPALAERASAANAFLGWIATSDAGEYPAPAPPPPGWGGEGGYYRPDLYERGEA